VKAEYQFSGSSIQWHRARKSAASPFGLHDASVKPDAGVVRAKIQRDGKPSHFNACGSGSGNLSEFSP
jgi:hypothetical protein